MWFELKVAFVLGMVWVMEKLRIITPEDAEAHRGLLVTLALVEAYRKRERERGSWTL